MSQGSTISAFPGATPMVSANGTSNAIVWALQTDAYSSNGPAVLHAYNGANLATELYNSNQNLNRDNSGGAVKFTVPVVANGKVFVGAVGLLSVYGLLSAYTTATPTFSPAPGKYSSTVAVTLADFTPNATIYYTLDGSTPTVSSPQYTAPISIGTTTTVKAVGAAPGYNESAIASGTYRIRTGGH